MCAENKVLPPHIRTGHPPREEKLRLSVLLPAPFAASTRASQVEFAERANGHRTYISSIEFGKVSMGIEIAHALAWALGLKLSELVHKAE